MGCKPTRFWLTKHTTQTRLSRRHKSVACKSSSLTGSTAKKNQRILDRLRYKARHLVENLFQRMKVFRRVATRFDKLDTTFLGFVHIAGIMKWLH